MHTGRSTVHEFAPLSEGTPWGSGRVSTGGLPTPFTGIKTSDAVIAEINRTRTGATRHQQPSGRQVAFPAAAKHFLAAVSGRWSGRSAA